MHYYTRFAKIELWKSLRFAAPVFAFVSLLSAGCSSTTQPAPDTKIAPNTAARKDTAATSSTSTPSLTPQPTAKQIAALSRVQKLAAQWADVKMANLPQNNQFGILICEPGTSGNADVAHFGAGMARWLQFHVGGQGELGKTPAWLEVEITRRALKKSNLQLSTVDAAQLPAFLGVTHTVTGRIDRKANTYIWSLQLWKLEKRNDHWETVPLGNVTELRGSREQLLQQLPKTARDFSQRLQITVPETPSRVELNANEIQFLGSLTWDGKPRNASTQQTANWPKILQKSALANILEVASGETKYQTQLLQLAPQNALAQNIARNSPDTKLQKLRNEFFRNYLINETNSAVQNAPQNPHAWLQIATPKREAFFSALQATRMAPPLAAAWREVSRRARLLNENDVAELALWKALRLDATDAATYFWGAQLLGKNGLRDAAQFRQLEKWARHSKIQNADVFAKISIHNPVKKVANAPSKVAGMPLESVSSLVGLSPKVMANNIGREEANLRRNERDGKTRARLAKLYEQDGDVEKARGALAGWIALEPRNIEPLLQMAQLELRFNNRDAAKKVLQRAQRIDPQSITVRQLMKEVFTKAPTQTSTQ